MKLGPPEIVGFLGIVIFICGLFTLEKTSVGFYSRELVIGLLIIVAAYLMRKLKDIEELLRRLNRNEKNNKARI